MRDWGPNVNVVPNDSPNAIYLLKLTEKVMNIENIKFHDSILNEISINWKKSTLMLSTYLNKYYKQDLEKIDIICVNFKKFDCPHEELWGPSQFINELIVDKSSLVKIIIKMQSGDLIQIVCSEIEINSLS